MLRKIERDGPCLTCATESTASGNRLVLEGAVVTHERVHNAGHTGFYWCASLPISVFPCPCRLFIPHSDLANAHSAGSRGYLNDEHAYVERNNLHVINLSCHWRTVVLCRCLHPARMNERQHRAVARFSKWMILK
jgi:hypothetical protein